MRSISIFAALAATPALAHDVSAPHSHSEWALPVGLGLIALAAAASAMRARVSVRK